MHSGLPCSNEFYPTDHFTLWKLQNPRINTFKVVQKCRLTEIVKHLVGEHSSISSFSLVLPFPFLPADVPFHNFRASTLEAISATNFEAPKL